MSDIASGNGTFQEELVKLRFTNGLELSTPVRLLLAQIPTPLPEDADAAIFGMTPIAYHGAE